MSAAPATFNANATFPSVSFGAGPVAYGAAPVFGGFPVERQVFQEQVTVPQQFTWFQPQIYTVNVPQVTCAPITHTRNYDVSARDKASKH